MCAQIASAVACALASRRTNELSLVPPQFRGSALEAWEIERWESSSFLSLLSYS